MALGSLLVLGLLNLLLGLIGLLLGLGCTSGLSSSDRNTLSLGKGLSSVGRVWTTKLRDQDAVGSIVSVKRGHTRDGAASLSVNNDVSAVRVHLTVANSVVPDPLERGLARGSTRRDLDGDRVRLTTVHTFEAVAEDGLDHHPGFTVVVGQSPLAMATTMSSTNRVLGLDGLTGLVGCAFGVRGCFLTCLIVSYREI